MLLRQAQQLLQQDTVKPCMIAVEVLHTAPYRTIDGPICYTAQKMRRHL